MTSNMVPAVVFPPGEILRDELAERGWAEGEFAAILGRPVQVVSEILNGKKEITPETAIAIAAALGTSAELWLNMQAAHRLHQARAEKAAMLKPVERRAALRTLVPVRELQKRGWLPETDDLDRLEAAVRDLLDVEDLAQEPTIAIAARRSNTDVELTPEQLAWVARVQRLGAGRVHAQYDADALGVVAAGLVRRITGPQDLQHLHRWIADCGVALVIELPLRSSKIDGVVSFSGQHPIIGLSTRGDRMDGFVFTLLHEIAHLTLGHIGPGEVSVDEDIDGAGGNDDEQQANSQAARWVFERSPVVSGELSAGVLAEVARAHGVHPSFLIGRLQNEGLLEWSRYRKTIPKVRPFVEIG